MIDTDSIQMRLNGLHSGTVLRERNIGNGITEEWHNHPETGEVVIVHSWSVQDGDCVSRESEVNRVYHKQKGLVDCIMGMEVLFKSLERL